MKMSIRISFLVLIAALATAFVSLHRQNQTIEEKQIEIAR